MGGGLWLDMSVAIVHGATWGVPWVLRGRSNFRNQHSHTCKTTSASLSRDVAPGIPSPPPGRVIVVGPLKIAFRLSTTSPPPPPPPASVLH